MLFCSILFNEHATMEQVLSQLRNNFGEFVYKSHTMSFDFTSYYEKELGAPLHRIIVAFKDLVPRDCLPPVKIKTNEIEADFMMQGRRTANLDPGILTMENVNLATTKPYSHRIYLRDGIWAEVTLMYTNNSYRSLEWTYPDYASSEMIRIFHQLREIYKGRR